MTTTVNEADYVGRLLLTPDTDAHDYMGRVIVDDVDFLGRALLDTEEEGEPEPEFLLEDEFTGDDDDDWDAVKWARNGDTNARIQSNAGNFAGAETCCTAVTATDFELLVKATANTLASKNAEIGWRVGANVTTGTPSNGYVIQCGATVTMYKIDGYTSVATSASSGLTVSGTFWFRINVVGTTHKVRWWADGNAEPGTWQIDMTDATYAAGAFMLRSYGGPVTWDDLQITDLA